MDYLSSGDFYHWFDDSCESIRAFLGIFGISEPETSIDWSGCTIEAKIGNPRGYSPGDVDTEYLTGYCVDADMYHAFHASVKHSGDIRGAIIDALRAAESSIYADYEHSASMENFLEMAECNEWEFTADGSMY